MSDKTEKQGEEGGWVPSAEQPVPPTTEFAAVKPDAVESIDAPGQPDEEPAPAGTADDDVPTTGSAPQATDESAVDEEPEVAPAATTGSAPQADPPKAEAPTTSHPLVTPKPAPSVPHGATTPAGGGTPATEPPAWKTPPAAGLPPQWGDPDAKAAAATTGPEPTNDLSNLWGLAPEDRPEVLLGAALAGGVLTAILLRTLARR